MFYQKTNISTSRIETNAAETTAFKKITQNKNITKPSHLNEINLMTQTLQKFNFTEKAAFRNGNEHCLNLEWGGEEKKLSVV